jgi:hypothetical protein
MNLSEKLQKDMAGLKAHHQRIEALADSSLQKLGFVGARAVNTVYSHGNQSLAVTYYADSELNISEGESMGLRVAFEVCTAADAKIKVLAFSEPSRRLTWLASASSSARASTIRITGRYLKASYAQPIRTIVSGRASRRMHWLSL